MTSNISIIQTLYFNTNNCDPIDNSVRFLSPEFHWMSWALSCLQLKKLYGKVTLFTNEYGAEVLINRLKLPYDNVDLRLSNIKIDSGLGVLPKIYTYSFQNQPFLHFDGDVIMWEKLDDQLLDCPIITQNLEVADSFYRSFYNKLLDDGTWFPECIKNELDSKNLIRVFNLGIVGGNNIKFFKSFSEIVLEIIENNKSILHLIRNTNFNLTYEQHLFYCLTKLFNLNVNCYISKEVKNLCFRGYADFLNAPYQNKFVHLLGDYKKEEHTCLKLARRLRNDYPDYYYRIIDECKKAKVKLYLNYYEELTSPVKVEISLNDKVDMDFWNNLYIKEKGLFSLMDERFSNLDILLKTYFILNCNIDIDNVYEKNMYENDLYIKAPVSFLLAYNDLKLDTLDQVLVNLLKVKLSFEEILGRLKIFFDNDEIENDYDLFVKIISHRLKMGVEDNLFEIIV